MSPGTRTNTSSPSTEANIDDDGVVISRAVALRAIEIIDLFVGHGCDHTSGLCFCEERETRDAIRMAVDMENDFSDLI